MKMKISSNENVLSLTIETDTEYIHDNLQWFLFHHLQTSWLLQV